MLLRSERRLQHRTDATTASDKVVYLTVKESAER